MSDVLCDINADDEIAALVRNHAEANTALINGDANRYAELVNHADDYTLMAPFGGTPTRGFDLAPERLAVLGRFFRSGESKQELVQSYRSGDLVVLVMIERQRVAVADLPKQDWSLRVTQVYRRAGRGWQVVHRHADALVKGVSVEQAAAIARG